MADTKNDDANVGKQDPDSVTDEQKQDAIDASNVSLKDFNPDELSDEEKVVELPDGSSHLVKDLTDHENDVIAADARSVVNKTNPGQENYPNGPKQDHAKAEKSAENK